MNVVVTCSHHFDRTPDGRVWTNGTCPYLFWTRYFPVFASVRVVTRVREVPEVPSDNEPADGPGVTFFPIRDYLGPQQFLSRAPSILARARKAVRNRDALIFRAPSLFSMVPGFRRTKRPYGVEVVGDPYDVFSPNAIKHPLRPFFCWWFTRCLRWECARACAAAYVTERALQRRYPPSPRAFTTHYSSIDLPGTAFVKARRTTVPNGAVRLILVGTLTQLYKAPDVLIDAVGACVHEGLNIELVFVGSGGYQPQLEAQAMALGIGTRVQFCGQLVSADAVRAELDRADLFVLPSRQEGLPRAMIEAMARGLPCIGSTVGGIPELLATEDIVPPNDASALARKIREVLADPSRLVRMSARNLAKAREYSLDVLTRRRERFYEHVNAQTEAWLKQSPNGKHN
jgi:glycosyltransferase involved in cell wall biosynthesis